MKVNLFEYKNLLATWLVFFFQTLRVDYTKNLEGVLGILCQMISGKSFELILSAAAVTGKLPSLIIELIKYVYSSSFEFPILPHLSYKYYIIKFSLYSSVSLS